MSYICYQQNKTITGAATPQKLKIMTNLKFNPQVFRVSYEGTNGLTRWDLLTVDGENPDETIYFLLKGSSPSLGDADIIDNSIIDGNFEILTLEQSDNDITDFNIDLSLFDSAPNTYSEIVENLEALLPYARFSKKDIIKCLMQNSEEYYGEERRLIICFTKDELIEKLEDCSDNFSALDLLNSIEEGF